MSSKSEDKKANYKRPSTPPPGKKKQPGNPRKVRKSCAKKRWQIIEDVFGKEAVITENGESRRVTLFEAITLQLYLKSLSGSKRAVRILRRYEAFAKERPDYHVVTADEKAKREEGADQRYLELIASL
jgi:hypothetical protein